MMRAITAGLALALSSIAVSASAIQPEPLTEEDKWQLIGKFRDAGSTAEAIIVKGIEPGDIPGT